MKKGLVGFMAAACMFAFTAPAFAVQHEAGGYWRTRAYTQKNFDGTDSEARDLTRVDTRTRLYYTAKFSDNLKFVNKFEMDAVFGEDKAGYGDIGADGVAVEVKNSYVDATLGDLNMKVGVQGAKLGRGLLFNDDFAGAVATYKGEGFALPVGWIKNYEGGAGPDANDLDVDLYFTSPVLTMVDGWKINPYFLYGYTKGEEATLTPEEKIMYFGADIDGKIQDWGKVWLTGIYQAGELDDSVTSVDLAGFLVAGGMSAKVGMADMRLGGIYASGDEDPADDEVEAFMGPKGQMYYWAEIMGKGIFDTGAKFAYGPADDITNLMAINAGVTVKPMDKVKVMADVWYAALAEDDAVTGETEIGTEIDLRVSYQLVDGLNLDIVGAYLVAGDLMVEAAELAGVDEEDPYEVGTRLSVKF